MAAEGRTKNRAGSRSDVLWLIRKRLCNGQGRWRRMGGDPLGEDRLSMFQTISHHPQRQRLHFCQGLLLGASESHHSRKLWNLGEPTAVLFSIQFDRRSKPRKYFGIANPVQFEQARQSVPGERANGGLLASHLKAGDVKIKLQWESISPADLTQRRRGFAEGAERKRRLRAKARVFTAGCVGTQDAEDRLGSCGRFGAEHRPQSPVRWCSGNSLLCLSVPGWQI